MAVRSMSARRFSALVLGIILYIVFTLIDVDIIAERRELLLIFSAIFILLLFPFGLIPAAATAPGWRSAFCHFPSAAEICKIPFIMILAKTMSIRQNKISHISTVLRLAVITIFMFGLIVVASEEPGRCAAVSVYFRHYGVCRRCEPSVVSGRICRPACGLTVFVAVSQL